MWGDLTMPVRFGAEPADEDDGHAKTSEDEGHAKLGEVTPLGGRGEALREIAKIGTRSETAGTGALPGLVAETRRGYGLHLKRRSF